MECNCGKPAKYMHSEDRMSCNKYDVCPTYDELSDTCKQLTIDLSFTLKAAQDLLMFREGTSHYEKAEQTIEQIRAKFIGANK